MAKSPRVTFKLERVAEGEWRIQAICPGVETQYITGFKTKAEIDEANTILRRVFDTLIS